ncbi:hypothetical protein [Roseateles sp. PN1]|uniref:hypothetical protein n=1 Tax=Roseateles sp. PN1 TaxID=3137372 RepID=UPI0031389CBD
MSAAHTSGRLRISEEGPTIIKEDFRMIGTDGGALVGSTAGHPNSGFFPTVEEAIGNARRLVACWNACHGISTEELESRAAIAAAQGEQP